MDVHFHFIRTPEITRNYREFSAPAGHYWMPIPGATRISLDLGDDEEVSVGIIADIHQNSKGLEEVLSIFKSHGVRVIFALGDYSYIPKSMKGIDPADLRFQQFNCAVQLLLDFRRNVKGVLVILLGNHEIKDYYYKGGYSSRSYIKTRNLVYSLKKIPGVWMANDPFKSFEIDNAIEFSFCYGEESSRSFRLSHAISEEFVNSMYKGYPPKTNLGSFLKRLEEKVGSIWIDGFSKRIELAGELWPKFLGAKPHSAQRGSVMKRIIDNIRIAMSVDNAIKNAANSGHKMLYSSLKKKRILGKNEIGHFYYFMNTLRDYGSGSEVGLTSKQAHGIYRLTNALGAGRLYSIVGHFHADLGIFGVSEDYGTMGIAVPGFQPGKIISNQFAAFIIKCRHLIDKVYRITCDAEDLPEDYFKCDLSNSTRI